jgi:CRISPR/Cas system-associated exonuclease Cas4 (RecB family)
VDGIKVPRVTKILGRYKNSTGLIIWSNQLGLEGKSYHAELNKAGDIGTALHELAELHIKGEYYELPEDPIVQECFNKFKDWWSEQNYEVNFTEKSFCCRKYKYGGTADLVVNGDTIIDFKTSKAVYDDHLVQMSAYRYMIEEQDGIEINKGILARFGKETDDFEIREFSKSDLNKGFKYFKVLREAFDLDKQISKLTRKAKKK